MASDFRAHRRWRRLRLSILLVNDTCALCGKPGADTIDHIVPVHLGGPKWDPANLRPMHGAKRADCPGNYSLGATMAQRVKELRPTTPSRRWGEGGSDLHHHTG